MPPCAFGSKVILDIHNSKEALANIFHERANRLNTVTSYKRKKITAKQANIEVHFYNHRPISFLIFTENHLLTEQYHLGRLKTAKAGECIGGWTPIMLFHRGSTTYKIMKRHFDYIWEKCSRDITGSLIK